MFDSNVIQVSNTIVSVNRFRETFSSELIIERKNRLSLYLNLVVQKDLSLENKVFLIFWN